MTTLEVLSLVLAVILVYFQITSSSFLLNNILAMCFAIYAIENWLVGKFNYVVFIFAGLIIYDVGFVFHSDVMMTVA